MLDYIVVGGGLAGISFCERLEENEKSFMVIADESQQSSLVAGGLYNPVILKRFTLAWNAKEQLEGALPFYKLLEEKLDVQLDYKVPVLRRFTSIEEQNLWYEASDKKGLDYFLTAHVVDNINPFLNVPFGFGQVKYTGRIDTKTLLEAYSTYLTRTERFKRESFDYGKLTISDKGVQYKNVIAEKLVFAEGFGLKKNPFFDYLPLNGTKGELLTIKAPMLKENSVIKSSAFIIPLGNDFYRIGATYKWKDKTNTPTEASKTELLQKLGTFLRCDFEVVDHVAGIRPTVTDRRPLVGRHPAHPNLYVLNGFGSRGVMIAPYASEQLYNYIENKEALHPEMDIQRFKTKFT